MYIHNCINLQTLPFINLIFKPPSDHPFPDARYTIRLHLPWCGVGIPWIFILHPPHDEGFLPHRRKVFDAQKIPQGKIQYTSN